jgi:hypothetical protein
MVSVAVETQLELALPAHVTGHLTLVTKVTDHGLKVVLVIPIIVLVQIKVFLQTQNKELYENQYFNGTLCSSKGANTVTCSKLLQGANHSKNSAYLKVGHSPCWDHTILSACWTSDGGLSVSCVASLQIIIK